MRQLNVINPRSGAVDYRVDAYSSDDVATLPLAESIAEIPELAAVLL